MLNSIEGVYRDGKIELLEPVPLHAPGRVIVTFLEDPSKVDLQARGIDPHQAADLRKRLSTFADDWEHPGMDAYDAV